MNNDTETLKNLFEPTTIGIVGEIRNTSSWSHRILNNLVDHQFGGEILPVSPGGGTILGHQIYEDVREIHRNTDLLLLCTPLDQGVKIVQQVAEDGPSHVALISSGQSSDVEDPNEYFDELAQISDEHDIRILGPDSSGIFSSHERINATTLSSVSQEPGNIAFVSQSGSYGEFLFSQLEERGLNVGKFISIGAQVDISHVDVLSYLQEDPDTDVIALFVDEILNGPEFLRIAGETTLNKPIVAFLVSRTESGIKASLGGNYHKEAPQFPVYQAAFEQSGVQLFNNTDDFFDAITVFAGLEQQFPMSDDIGLISVSGGPAVAACDRAEEIDLPFTNFSEDLQDKLREALSPSANVANPIQLPLSTSADQLGEISSILADSQEVNGLVSLNIGFDEDSFASEFAADFQRELKPIISFASRCDSVETTFRERGIPVLPSPERAVNGMKFLSKYRDLMGNQKRKGLPDESVFEQIQEGIALSRNEPDINQLSELESKEYLQSVDLPIVDEIVTESQKEALNFARTCGLPVSAQVHKEGGQDDPELIYRDIDSIENLKSAYLSLRRRSNKKPIMIRSSEGPGIHLLARATRNNTFGIVLSFGLGGEYSNVLTDVSYRLAPIQQPEAKKMTREVGASDLLDGYKQYPPVDRDNVANILMSISTHMIENPDVQHIEINPLVAREQDVEIQGAHVEMINDDSD